LVSKRPGEPTSLLREFPMKRPFALACLFLLFSWRVSSQMSSPKPPALAFTHVTVIDTAGGAAQQDVTVLIRRGRIIDIGKGAKVHVPADSEVVDAAGKFLIPGLWDMHFHWYDERYLPLTIANGVTGVRVMLGYAEHYQWRKQIEAGQLLGPRMVIASRALDGPVKSSIFPGPSSTVVESPAEGRQAVINAREHGADFVKIVSYLSRDTFFAIADEAKKRRIPFAGHVPFSVSVKEASNAGQRSIEHLTGQQHLTGVLDACSSREEDLLKLWQGALAKVVSSEQTDSSLIQGPDFRARMQVALDTYDARKAESLFAVLKANHTWISPTLTTERSYIFFGDRSIASDAWLRYTAAGARGGWSGEYDWLSKAAGAEDVVLLKRVYQKDLELVGAMRRAGVEFLAGTDTGNPFTVPGFSLHNELALLIQAGFTPLEALQTATLNPARFLGREHDLGTVATGKLADLVLLNANPLEDISNTRRIAAVVYRGKLYPRAALDAQLSDIQALAHKKSVGDLMEATIKEKGVQAAIQQYRELKSAQPNSYDFGIWELNDLGDELLADKKFQAAIQIFALCTEMFPNSWWAYDGLGDAYIAVGQKELAINSFKKSQQLDPLYQYATSRLRELNAQ
jgi:imidazolonepropionase-like amidohydrolase